MHLFLHLEGDLSPLYLSILTLPPYSDVVLKENIFVLLSELMNGHRKLFLIIVYGSLLFRISFSFNSLFQERPSLVVLSKFIFLSFLLPLKLVCLFPIISYYFQLFIYAIKILISIFLHCIINFQRARFSFQFFLLLYFLLLTQCHSRTLTCSLYQKLAL